MINILLVTYQSEKHIQKQLQSIFDQVNVEFKVHVFDDGSNDNTLQIINDYQARYSNIIFYENKIRFGTPGLSFLHLLSLIEYEESDLFAFSDHDDIWNANKLKRAETKLKDNSANLYSAPVRAIWPSGKKRILSQTNIIRDHDCIFEGAGQGCSYVFDSKILNGLKAAKKVIDDKKLIVKSHDWVTYIVCRAYEYKWYFDKDFISLDYIQHNHNDLGAKGTIRSYIGRFGLIFSGWYKRQIQMYSYIYVKLMKEKRQDSNLKKYISNFNKPYYTRVFFNTIFVLKNGRRYLLHRLYLATLTIMNLI